MMFPIMRAGVSLFAVILLLACSSDPLPPRLLQSYERELRQGKELVLQGRLSDARKSFMRAVAAARLDDNSRHLVTALLALGDVEFSLEAIAAACSRAEDAAGEAATLRGEPVGRRLEWQVALARAECALQTDASAQVAPLLADLPTFVEVTDETRMLQVHRLNQIALAEVRLGELSGASETIARAVAVANTVPDSAALAASLANRALIHQSRSDLPAAIADARAALELDRTRHEPRAIAESHALLSRLLATVEPQTAAQHRRKAVDIFTLTGQEARIRRLGLESAAEVKSWRPTGISSGH